MMPYLPSRPTLLNVLTLLFIAALGLTAPASAQTWQKVSPGGGSTGTPCADLPECTSGNVSTVPVCRVPGGDAGLPLCTHRADLSRAMPWSGASSGVSNNVDGIELGGGALQACNNLGDGWYLPNRGELNTLYVNRTAVGGFGGGRYFSSTVRDDDQAYARDFSSGSEAHPGKYGHLYVRCVRR